MYMGQALYRKYRSKTLSEIVGQEHITSTLTNALKSNQISHAYLFTGPRGVGKTSIARILAHEVNGFSYSEDDNYLDIIEIDAASNRRIDEIRELRDKVNLAPSSGKFKVYIIDEVHMLTREAFNALLKTLEEPPAHAIFILATTEAHKVPETIISRTQQFNFRPIPSAQIIGQLKSIAEQEKINIDENSLKIISEYGQGSFRDSISLLDQASSLSNKITETELQSLLGLAPSKIIESIIKSIETGSLETLSNDLKNIDEGGYNLTVVCKQLLLQLKNSLLENKTSLEPEKILGLMKSIVDVPSSTDSLISLEIVLLGAVIANQDKTTIIPKVEVETTIIEETIIDTQQLDKIITENEGVSRKEEEPTQKKPKAPKATKSNPQDLNEATWQDVLNSIKTKYNTLYGIIRMAAPNFQPDELILKTKFDFHQRLLNDPKNQLIIINTVYDLTGKTIKLRGIVDKNLNLEAKPQTIENPAENDLSITTINNIFGSSEVIQ
jgi:DNA polymerase-3 subunit gamma/tau